MFTSMREDSHLTQIDTWLQFHKNFFSSFFVISLALKISYFLSANHNPAALLSASQNPVIFLCILSCLVPLLVLYSPDISSFLSSQSIFLWLNWPWFPVSQCFITQLIKTITKFSNVIGYEQPDFKQLLDEVFVISRIIEVEVGVISRSRKLSW